MSTVSAGMISAELFADVWERLEARFGKHEDASAYLAYLDSQGVTDRELVEAAQALWATGRWFPRPADFLLVRAGSAWLAVLTAVRARPWATVAEYEAVRAAIGERGWTALETLGGIHQLREARDLLSVRREFLQAFEAGVAEAAMAALPPATVPATVLALRVP